jgi:hypothetical protein
MKSTHSRLAEIARRLSRLLSEVPDDEAVVDTLDYLAGALYSLFQLEPLPFWERRGPRLPDYRSKLRRYVADMAHGEQPGDYWLSGYFLNSALQRIAGCYDRIPKLFLGIEKGDRRPPHELMTAIFGDERNYRNWKALYSEMNPLKHWAVGLSQKRAVGKSEAIRALEEILSLVQAKKPELVKVYPAKPAVNSFADPDALGDHDALGHAHADMPIKPDISSFATYVAMAFHEARNVRHLVKAGHLDKARYQRLITGMPTNREKAWKALEPLRREAASAGSAREAENVFRRSFGLSLEDLATMSEDSHLERDSDRRQPMGPD